MKELIYNIGSVYCAERALEQSGVGWSIKFQNEFEYYDQGIHIYYKDEDGDDLAYFTPALGCLAIFSSPRPAPNDSVGRKYEIGG